MGLPSFADMKVIEPADIGAHPLPIDGNEPAASTEQWFSFGEEASVRNVNCPALLPVLPTGEAKGRTAIIIAPGGGFTGLRYTGEGTDIARRLAEAGIAAFVLKYRTLPTVRDHRAFVSWFESDMTTPREGGDADFPLYPPALPDARAAIRHVRENADAYGIDPHKVGFLGFSAGGIVALNVAQETDASSRADFVMPIYPQMNTPVVVPEAPPPLFLAIAGDDNLFGRQDLSLVQKWQRGGGSAELHFYAAGGHGFGLSPRGTTSDNWFEHLKSWLRFHRLLEP